MGGGISSTRDVWIDEKHLLCHKLIGFEATSDKFKGDAEDVLQSAAAFLKENPWILKCRIEGNANDLGDTPENDAAEMKLSYERATIAKRFLVSQGVESERLFCVGMGDKMMLTTEHDKKKLNHRVELRILQRDKDLEANSALSHAEVKGKEIKVRSMVKFKPKSSHLDPESIKELNSVAKLMKEKPHLRVRVDVHVDDRGDSASLNRFEMILSQGQAEGVVEYLKEKGVAGDRLEAKGWGDTKPVIDPKTKTKVARARVDFIIL